MNPCIKQFFLGASLQVFHDAKQSAQNISSYWLFQFQAFIFALLK
jgi:hypothetical protein